MGLFNESNSVLSVVVDDDKLLFILFKKLAALRFFATTAELAALFFSNLASEFSFGAEAFTVELLLELGLGIGLVTLVVLMEL